MGICIGLRIPAPRAAWHFIRTPTLICQGERDTFGRREEVDGYTLAPSIRFHWLTDGDHGFKPRKASGLTLEQNISASCQAILRFIHSIR